MLEFAILGLLHEAPMHGYVLRKRLHETLGTFRTFSYGSLYPTLRRLQRAGFIAEDADEVGELALPICTLLFGHIPQSLQKGLVRVLSKQMWGEVTNLIALRFQLARGQSRVDARESSVRANGPASGRTLSRDQI